ncbi:MAG: MFS transporter [Candidatus Odinarchaeota archaeon]
MSTTANVNTSNRKQNLFSLSLASFIVVSGYSVITPFLPIYANDILYEFNILGFTVGIALQIGFITAGNLLMKLFLSPAYGDLSDIRGRKPVIVLGMATYTLLMAGYGLANDFLSLFTLRVLSGVASAAVWPVGQALVADTSDKESTGKNLGLYMLSMMLGLTTGPFIGYGFFTALSGAGLSELTSYRFTFVCVSLLGLLGTLCAVFLVTDPITSRLDHLSRKELYGSAIKALAVRTIQSPVFLARTITGTASYRTKSIYSVYLVAMINGFATALLIPVVTLFLEDYYFLDPGSIALIIGIVGVLAFAGAPAGGTLSDKIGRKRTVVASGLSNGLIMGLLGVRTGIITLIIIFVLLRFSFTVMQPSFRALQSDLVPEKVRGKEFGIVDASFNTGSVVGPIIGGYLYDLYTNINFDLGNGLLYIGSGVPFAISGALIILANLILLVFLRQSYAIKVDQDVTSISS